MYFITICAEGRVNLFGSKEAECIRLSEIGRLVEDCWVKITEMNDFVSMDSYVVMPNHIHGILVYNKKDDSAPLGHVIRNFKSYTTHEYYKDKFRLTGNLWQRGYYEHVIRHGELDRIRGYIRTNPANWEHDRFYEMERMYLQSLPLD